LIIHRATGLLVLSRQPTKPTKAKYGMPLIWRATARSGFAVSIPSSPTITKMHLTNIRHVPNIPIAQSASIGLCIDMRLTSRKCLGDCQCLWLISRVLDVKNARKRYCCGSSSLKNPVSMRRLSNARNALSAKLSSFRSLALMSQLLGLWHRRERHRLAAVIIRCGLFRGSEALRHELVTR